MSIPREHHYLPQFYTARWATEGTMVRYARPAPDGSLHAKSVMPRAIGKQRDLYAFSTAANEAERQRLELEYFQPIDGRAAVALQKLDAGVPGSVTDKVGLVQFVISLMHRSPSRIKHLQAELSAKMIGTADFDPNNPKHQTMISDHINHLLSDLISSQNVVHLIAGMKVFRIEVQSRHKLLTGDIPLMLSQGLAHPLGFLMFPYAPNRVAIFAHDEGIARAFSSQDNDVLARALNDAVVRQAKEFVIAADDQSKRFVENRYLKDPEPVKGDGLLRWQAP